MDVAKICDKLRNVFNEMNEQFFVFFTNCYVYKFIKHWNTFAVSFVNGPISAIGTIYHTVPRHYITFV